MLTTEPKEIHAPQKKNRIQSVQPLVTEDTRSQSPTTPPPTDRPPLDTSPPSIQTDEEAKEGPTEIGGLSSSPVHPALDSCKGKRRRDDGDQNPRETKRISPPPDQEKDGVQAQSAKSVSGPPAVRVRMFTTLATRRVSWPMLRRPHLLPPRRMLPTSSG